MLIDCFPDLSNTADTLTTDEDAIKANVTIGGTQIKDFMGIANEGCRFGSDHIFVFRFNEADQIQSLTINWDHAGMVAQLGR